MRFTEERLEQAIIELLEEEDYRHVLGRDIAREPSEVLIKEDLRHFLAQHRLGGWGQVFALLLAQNPVESIFIGITPGAFRT